MEYQYKKAKAATRKLKGQDGGVWAYIPLKEFLAQGMDRESIIFGDASGSSGDNAPLHISMQQNGEEKTLRMHRYRGKLSFFDKVLGYIMATASNGKEGYVRIRKRSYIKIWILTGVLMTVIAGGVTAIFWDRGPSLDKNAIAYQLPGQVKNTDPDAIMLPGYDVLTLKQATKRVDIALLNPDGNTCYFKFTIVLKDSGEELYKTGLIKPGTAVTSFTVEKDLKKGTYPIVIKVDTADLKDPENMFNGGAVEATLEVK